MIINGIKIQMASLAELYDARDMLVELILEHYDKLDGCINNSNLSSYRAINSHIDKNLLRLSLVRDKIQELYHTIILDNGGLDVSNHAEKFWHDDAIGKY